MRLILEHTIRFILEHTEFARSSSFWNTRFRFFLEHNHFAQQETKRLVKIAQNPARA